MTARLWNYPHENAVWYLRYGLTCSFFDRCKYHQLKSLIFTQHRQVQSAIKMCFHGSKTFGINIDNTFVLANRIMLMVADTTPLMIDAIILHCKHTRKAAGKKWAGSLHEDYTILGKYVFLCYVWRQKKVQTSRVVSPPICKTGQRTVFRPWHSCFRLNSSLAVQRNPCCCVFGRLI